MVMPADVDKRVKYILNLLLLSLISDVVRYHILSETNL